MRLWEWVNDREWGILRTVERATGIAYPALHEYYSEKRVVRDYERAELIARATGGAVTVRELMTHRVGKRPAKRVSKRAQLAAAKRPARARKRRKVAA